MPTTLRGKIEIEIEKTPCILVKGEILQVSPHYAESTLKIKLFREQSL